MKYYPWKDLYDKNIEAPFQHNIREPWDPKYTNAPDKLGVDTKERYENILRSENFKGAFENYYFYYNAFDPNDRNNPKESRILPNNHHKLQNGLNQLNNSNVISQGSLKEDKLIHSNSSFLNSNNNNNTNDKSSFVLRNSSSQTKILSNHLSNKSGVTYKKIDGSTGDIKVMTNIESKFSKIKQMSNSGSASSLLRQYRVSGISSYNGTGSTNNQVRYYIYIILIIFIYMLFQNRSLVGSFVSSNNSNSTSSNSNQNYNISGGYMRKSGSSSYIAK